ncbi:Erythrocyte membrane antigen 1 [Balamuthia mandrillaris]
MGRPGDGRRESSSPQPQHSSSPYLTVSTRAPRKKNKLFVDFNNADRNEFVTGFRKRKQKRRTEALQQKARKERQERIDRRKAERDALKALVEERKKQSEGVVELTFSKKKKHQRAPGMEEMEQEYVRKSFAHLLDAANGKKSIENEDVNEEGESGEERENEEKEKEVEYDGKETFTTVTITTLDTTPTDLKKASSSDEEGEEEEEEGEGGEVEEGEEESKGTQLQWKIGKGGRPKLTTKGGKATTKSRSQKWKKQNVGWNKAKAAKARKARRKQQK